MLDRDCYGVHHAEQVDVTGVYDGHRIVFPPRGQRKDACVGHDDVDLAEIAQPRVERLVKLVALADCSILDSGGGGGVGKP
jgi:hypothetical protein